MSKKVKIIFIVMSLIISISIITFAIIKLVSVPTLNQVSIEEGNKNENNRALAEKEKFAKEHQNKAGSSIAGYDIESQSINDSSEDIVTYPDDEDGSEQVRAILERYYSKEKLNELAKNIENSYATMGDWTNEPISKAEEELYNMMFDVIEKGNLSKEDSNAVKEYLKSQISSINKSNELKNRADKIL